MPEVFPFKAYAYPLIEQPENNFYPIEFDPALVTDGSTATRAPSLDEYPLPGGWISDWFFWYEFDTPPSEFELSFTARARQDTYDAGLIDDFNNDILVRAYTSTPFVEGVGPSPVYSQHVSSAWTPEWVTSTITPPAVPASTTWWFALYAHRISAPAHPPGSFTTHDLAEVRLIADGATIPPTRLFPRDDTGGNTPRIYPPPRSIQSGNRLDTYY